MSDAETVQTIQENPYIQYFLDFDEFIIHTPFIASLFVEWRKKLGNETFNQFADVLFKVCFSEKVKAPTNPSDKENTSAKKLPNKGKLKLDATVADQ